MGATQSGWKSQFRRAWQSPVLAPLGEAQPVTPSVIMEAGGNYTQQRGSAGNIEWVYPNDQIWRFLIWKLSIQIQWLQLCKRRGRSGLFWQRSNAEAVWGSHIFAEDWRNEQSSVYRFWYSYHPPYCLRCLPLVCLYRVNHPATAEDSLWNRSPTLLPASLVF